MDELEALKLLDSTLSSLDGDSRTRSLEWINGKYGWAPASTVVATIPTTALSGAATPLNLSMATIAQRLGAKSAYDVLRAASASLTFVHQRDHFPWKDVLAEAARATGYWTKHHPSNATKALKSLGTANVLVELANGDLALTPTAKDALATELGVS